MLIKVINGEGQPENENSYSEHIYVKAIFDKANPKLKCLLSNGEIPDDGEYEGERIEQYYYKSQIIDSGIWSNIDVDCSQNQKTETRQVYIVSPIALKEAEVLDPNKETIEEAEDSYYWSEEALAISDPIDRLRKAFIAGANWQKRQSNLIEKDKVIEVLENFITKHDCWQSRYADLIETIKELK